MNAPVQKGGLSAFSKVRAMSIMSTALNRLGLRFGTAFGGKRDYYETFGYERILTFQHCLNKYARQDIARRVIDQPVDGVWTDPPTLWTESEEFDAAWGDLVARLQLFSHLATLDKLAGLGKFALLVVGYDDGRDMSTAVSKKDGRKIIYLQPYGEGSVKIKTFDENQASPRFGKPIMYEVTPGDSSDLSATRLVENGIKRRPFNVHYTRALHVAEGALENALVGHPRMEPCYNLLDDMQKVVGGSAETFWLTANRGLQIDVDKEIEMNADDEENLSDEIDEYEHGIRRIIRTRGVKVNNIGSDVPSPEGHFKILIALISAVSGIPQRMLLGAEAGQLASEQDRAQWAQRMQERIATYAEPQILLPFIAMNVTAGALPDPGTIDVDWPEAFKLNPLERGQASAQMARSAANLVRARNESIYPPGAVTIRSQDISVTNAEKAAEAVKEAGGEENPDEVRSRGRQERSQADGELIVLADRDKDGEIIDPPTSGPAEKLGEEVFTIEEIRQIVGFGKRPPVFDDDADASGATKAKPTG